MDFLDPKKRRAHQIRLFIGYGLMGILVTMIAVLLLFQAYGYTFNVNTGDISQNSLLFVDSRPVPAQLTVNGEAKGTTDQRLVLPEGDYALQLNQTGYREWRHDVVLEGGKIERFIYPFLFPTELVTETTDLFTARPAFATQSPDRQWLLVQNPGSVVNFRSYNLNQEAPTAQSVTFPEALFTLTGNTHTLELVEWSNDNQHVLVKHSFEGGSEFIMLNWTEPTQSVNLTAAIPTAFTSLRLRDKRWNSYYVYSSSTKTLQRYTLGAPAAETILTDIQAFQPHGDDELLYVTNEKAPKNKVLVRMIDNGRTYTVKELPTSKKYLLELARFENKWFMAMGAVSDGKVYILRDPADYIDREPPTSILPASILRLADPQFVSFSQNARFIAVQSGSKFAVYDAENDRNHLFDTKLDAGSQKAAWMDGHRLSLIHEQQHVVFDFDGTNTQTLADAYGQFIPFFDRDYTAVYTLAPSDIESRAALLRTALIIED